MKDLISALALFTDLKPFKKINIETENKYTLCYFPLVGLIMGALMTLFSAFVFKIGFGDLVFLAPAFMFLITGRVHYNAMLERMGKKTGIIIYIVFLAILCFPFFTVKEAVACAGVFIIARALSILLFIDNDYLSEGVYKSLSKSSQRFAVSIITVVWLMAGVALVQMVSLYYFFAGFAAFALLYFVFSRRTKSKKLLTDNDINLFIVLSEAAVLAGMKLIICLPVIIKVFWR